MPRTHYIRECQSGLFFRECLTPKTAIPPFVRSSDGTAHWPSAQEKATADLYEQHEACDMATRLYGQDWHTRGKAEIIQATTAEYLSWRGRKGGSVTSAKKQRVSRRNGRRGGRKRICRACGDELAPTVPVNVHVCEECKA
jgi:hypothetical protein